MSPVPIAAIRPKGSGVETSWTDYLTSLSNWIGPGASLVGGKVVITPTLGAELLTNGGYDNWTGDNPNSWNLSAAEDASNYVNQNPAGKANLVTRAAASFSYNQNFALGVGTWFRWAFDLTINSGANHRVALANTTSSAGRNTTLTSPVFTGRVTNANPNVAHWRSSSGDANVTLDNDSVKQSTLSTMCLVRRCSLPTWNLTTPLTAAFTPETQMGIIFGLDDPTKLDLGTATFGLAVLDGAGNFRIDKCAAGTWSAVLAPTALAQANNKKIDCKKSDSQTYQFYYSLADFATAVGTAQTITGLTGQWFGLFSTHEANQFDPASNPVSIQPYSA